MHPLLLFTLFFIPGIKTSYLRPPESNIARTNNLDSVVKSDDTAVGEPRLHHKEIAEGFKGHHRVLFDRHRAVEFERRRLEDQVLQPRRHLLPSGKDSKNLQLHHEQTYAATPSPEFHHKGIKDKFHDEKKHYKKNWNPKFHSRNDEKSVHFVPYKKNKSHKEKHVEWHGKHNENGKRFGKNILKDLTEIDRSRIRSSEEKREKYVKDDKQHFRMSHSFDKERKLRSERVKRKADSTESDESFHGGEYEESLEDDNDKSDGSNENIEKLIIAQLMEGAIVQDGSYPYQDFVNVHLPKRNEGSVKKPVAEELITKSKSYVSCNDNGNSLGCQRKKPLDNTKDFNQVQEEQFLQKFDAGIDSAKPMDDKDSSDVDEEAWLRALEEEIMNSGIDVQLHH